ncbi:hypothetical protein CSC70_09435 [Pseudoxanthomonas kalamensis DSM 18571]|uniref:ArnT family glycosyltransferase n=1 Tax=Pseudoxanthomonas kalamensis TaxID=289483 RepID=UPI00139086DB|nr:glycosyltransferase family 39 protein [Pseudoxanthomonas kalamensis]KAF1709906.1 hypothetical protein CSC70_09435 [Pseudoxanthomonas kalamensis DSM 18571]
MQQENRARHVFLALWIAITAIKLLVAARLPLFVDEAFYWQEGRHLALAYSDLPGLTAWLIRLGTEIGGQHVLAVRMPFLLLAALLPWLVAHITARWYGENFGWRAGSLMLLMPLAGSLGILALPDVPMLFATVLCLDAGARLLRGIDGTSAAELALGLVIGALSHYRFVGVIGVGFLALLFLPDGRRLFRDVRIWIALAMGIAAWAPLLLWNLENADAGLRFQLVERHPWAFQSGGLWFLLIQAALVTPLLFVALMQVFARSLRPMPAMPVQWRYFGLLGGVSTLGYFVLGFFADVERVSFHWPLPGYVALLIGVPACLAAWPVFWRRLCWILAGIGLIAVLGYYVAVSVPELREQAAASKYYPSNFSGWDRLADAVREELRDMPAGTRVLADNFKAGAELGFALDDADIAVLDHPLNHKHGRAPQLRLWSLQSDGSRDGPVLLVVTSTDVKLREQVDYYQSLCKRLGPLPPPRVVSIDHGGQRFLLFRLPAQRGAGKCIAPAIAHINQPRPGERVSREFAVQGWAIKEGAGIKVVTVMLDDKPVADAMYGVPEAWVTEQFYRGHSRDPNLPRIGFKAQVDVSGMSAGRHWLGLRLHGTDGSDEIWIETAIDIRP